MSISRIELPTRSDILYEAILRELARDDAFKAANPIPFYENSQQAALIIDPRYDELMEGVICNFMYFMSPQGWNLCIASYRGHEAAIRAAFPHCIFIAIPDELLTINEKGEANMNIHTYNELMMSEVIYQTIPATHLAIFQKDCIMYKMFPAYFAQVYGFAGANNYEPQTPIYGGINGGFSLRNTQQMLECIRQVSMERIRETFPSMMGSIKPIPGVEDQYTMPEDVYFTCACEILAIPVPDKIHRAYLAIECDQWPNTSVYHGWNKVFQSRNYHSWEFAVNQLRESPLWSKYLDIAINIAINKVINNAINEKTKT